MTKITEIKKNDVFRFHHKDGPFTKIHCFDGIFVVAETEEGDLWLVDTYWGIGNNNSKMFNLKHALKLGTLEPLGNLDDYHEILLKEEVYYADEDLMKLPIQSGQRTALYVKKGTGRSTEKMESMLLGFIEETTSDIERATSKLEHYKMLLGRVKAGDAEVYIP